MDFEGEKRNNKGISVCRPGLTWEYFDKLICYAVCKILENLDEAATCVGNFLYLLRVFDLPTWVKSRTVANEEHRYRSLLFVAT